MQKVYPNHVIPQVRILFVTEQNQAFSNEICLQSCYAIEHTFYIEQLKSANECCYKQVEK